MNLKPRNKNKPKGTMTQKLSDYLAGFAIGLALLGICAAVVMMILK